MPASLPSIPRDPPSGWRPWLNAARSRASRRAPAGAGADPLVHLAAAARRLPGAGQPAVVHARAARTHRTHRARDADAVTVLIKPGWEWPGHRPGQYLRLGIEVNGRPPLARLLADLRARARRRVHLDHAQARARRRQGLAVPVRTACAPARSCASAASKAPSRCPTRCLDGCCSSAPAAGSRRS